jgi:hypothetical protein
MKKMTATEAYNRRIKQYDASRKPATGKRRKRSASPVKHQTLEHFGKELLDLEQRYIDSFTLNTNKNIQMKIDQSERYLIPSYKGPRPISLYSLRPGDWLRTSSATGDIEYDLLVVQNSGLLKKIELMWPSGQMEAAEYANIVLTGEGIHYLGHGHKRWWIRYVPKAIRRLQPYADPLAFIALDPAFGQLRDGFDQDMARARSISAALDRPGHRLHLLPAEPWARRAGGVLANELARSAPAQAHALLTRLPAGGFVVSVRAPLTRRQGADDLCRRFPGSGGRPAAAGINELPDSLYDDFVAAFLAAF